MWSTTGGRVAVLKGVALLQWIRGGVVGAAVALFAQLTRGVLAAKIRVSRTWTIGASTQFD